MAASMLFLYFDLKAHEHKNNFPTWGNGTIWGERDPGDIISYFLQSIVRLKRNTLTLDVKLECPFKLEATYFN